MAFMKSLYIRVHPSHPQKRLVAQAATIIGQGGVLACPTDACYSLICKVGDKQAEDRIRAIRHVERDHYFTLLCGAVSDLPTYAKVSNAAFRIIKMLTPGPYTFILPATRETPRRLQDPKRRTVGIRIPNHPFVQELLALLAEPLLASTVMNDAINLPHAEPEEIADTLAHALDAVIDGGNIGIDMTTIIDLTEDMPVLRRAGKGDISRLPDLL